MVRNISNGSSKSSRQDYKKSNRKHPNRFKVLLWNSQDNLKQLRAQLDINKNLIMRERGTGSYKRKEIWCPNREAAVEIYNTVKAKARERFKFHVSLGRDVSKQKLVKRSTNSGKKTPETEHINILHWNARSLRNKIEDLKQVINETKSKIVCIQESFLSQDEKYHPKFPDYALFDHSRQGRRGGGVAFLLHKSLPIRNTTRISTTHIEAITTDVQVHGSCNLTIVNAYIPNQGVTLQELDAIKPKTRNYIIAGDFNARHLSWDKNSNPNGHVVYQWIQNESMVLCNKDKLPTYQSPSSGSLSTLDLSIVSANLTLQIENWRVGFDLGSDHLPVHFTLSFSKKVSNKNLTPQNKYKISKANWDTFREKVDEHLSTHNDKLTDIENAISLAAEASIPRTRNRKSRPANIWWTSALTELRRNRQRARKRWMKQRNTGCRIEYNRANAIFRREVLKARRSSWREFVSSINSNTPASAAWRRFKSIEGRSSNTINLIKSRDGMVFAEEEDIANLLNTEYAKKSAKAIPFPKTLTIEEQYLSCNLDLLTLHGDLADTPFTINELVDCLTDMRNSAPGEDNIHNAMLKNLSQQSLREILILFNNIWNTGNIPERWKQATIIPILKPTKEPDVPESYRPISLTSCLGKLMERLVSRRLVWRLETENKLHPKQFGYRPRRGTIDALLHFTESIYRCYSDNSTAVALMVDLEAAFDKVPHSTILLHCLRIGIRGKMLKYLQNFLKFRKIKTKVNNTLSNELPIHSGVPQGSVLSATLFNIALCDMLVTLPNTTDSCIYADDITIWSSNRDPKQATKQVQDALNTLNVWTEKWNMTISSTKTECTFFTRKYSLKHFTPELEYKGKPVPYNQNPTLLGITLDPKLLWKNHIQRISTQCTKRLNLLKIVASRAWGADTLMLRQFFLSFVRSKMMYGAEIWGTTAETHLNKLKIIQNSALRTCLGCPKTTPARAMEIELNIEPLETCLQKVVCRRFFHISADPTSDPALRPGQRGVHHKSSFGYRITSVAASTPSMTPVPYPTVNCIPPWIFQPPRIELDLPGLTSKKDPVAIQRAAALEVIHSRYEDHYRIYTDGSLDLTASRSGAGYFAECSGESFFVPADSCSSTDTELLAINAAVAHCIVVESKKICILSDSKSALQLLKQYKPSSYYHRVQEILKLLTQSEDKEICFQWIPSHCGIQGNERADQVAKAATNMHPIPSKQLPLTSCIAASHRLLRHKWVEQWNSEPTGRHLYRLLKEPNNTDIYKNIARSVSTFASRARMGHIVTQSYLFRFQLAESPLCLVCHTEEETIQHILLDCNSKSDARDELKRRLHPDCTIERVLTDPTCWRLANHIYETPCGQHNLKLDARTKKKKKKKIIGFSHYIGKKHKKNMEKWYMSYKCDIPFPSVPKLELLMNKEELEEECTDLEWSYICYGPDCDFDFQLMALFKKSYCHLCNIPLTSKVVALEHYEGKSHFKKIQEWYRGNSNGLVPLPKDNEMY